MALSGVLYPLENAPKLQKDLLLADLFSQGSAKGNQSELYLAGFRCCNLAQKIILGISSERKKRVRMGRVDSRFITRDKATSASGAYGLIYSHLWTMYCSVAEELPEEPPCLINAKHPLVPATKKQKTSVERFHAVQQASLHGPGFETFMLEASPDLPVRYLPPGAKRDAWWSYLASAQADGAKPMGSYRTLLRVWNECFQQILKFKRFSRFTGCTTCVTLKERVQTAASYADKLYASRQLHQHHEQQWRDRMIYWRMRAHAGRPNTRWIVIIIDGADQAKFKVLKVASMPKNIEGEHRPQMKVEGVWTHGREMAFNFFEENVPHGANLTIDCLVNSLDRVLRFIRSGNGDTPAHLWIQADNAGGENKNIHVLKFLGLLVDLGVFRSTVASFLQVGHTHEDIDGLFSVMSRSIRNLIEWNTPMQMVESGPQLCSERLLPSICALGEAMVIVRGSVY